MINKEDKIAVSWSVWWNTHKNIALVSTATKIKFIIYNIQSKIPTKPVMLVEYHQQNSQERNHNELNHLMKQKYILPNN